MRLRADVAWTQKSGRVKLGMAAGGVSLGLEPLANAAGPPLSVLQRRVGRAVAEKPPSMATTRHVGRRPTRST